MKKPKQPKKLPGPTRFDRFLRQHTMLRIRVSRLQRDIAMLDERLLTLEHQEAR